jgi:DNA-binding transcriptional regulator YhcF (GntR family)
MEPNWNDTQPIYRQLRDRIVTMILEGVVNDGDALPSVRQVAGEYQLNPLTALLADERRRFLEDQWPGIAATIRRLGLDPQELLDRMNGQEARS